DHDHDDDGPGAAAAPATRGRHRRHGRGCRRPAAIADDRLVGDLGSTLSTRHDSIVRRMIPIRDVIPSRTTPFVTMTLIGMNVAAFIAPRVLDAGDRATLVAAWGVTPAAFRAVTLFTSMFLHAGWLHLGGNMLSLWIFGDNVEDRMGHARYLLFYLAAGAV